MYGVCRFIWGRILERSKRQAAAQAGCGGGIRIPNTHIIFGGGPRSGENL